MAPHWKCGSGQPVAGSNPALSATASRADGPGRVGACAPRSRTCGALAPVLGAAFAWTAHPATRRAMTDVDDRRDRPVELGTFRFPATSRAGEAGRRHGVCSSGIAGGVLLFDTGFGFGNAELDARTTRIRPAASPTSWPSVGVDDRRDRRRRQLPPPRRPRRPERPRSRDPDLRPAGRMGDRPHDGPHDPRLDRLRRRRATSRSTGDHEPCPTTSGSLATPGPHARPPVARRDDRRRRRRPRRPGLLHGRRVGRRPGALEGRSARPDRGAYDRSIERLRALDPVARSLFGHDRAAWTA